MSAETPTRLRLDQDLVSLPSGADGARITVQFLGPVPSLPRGERRLWLQKHFTALAEDLAREGILIKPGNVSASAQTIESVCPVDELGRLSARVEQTNHRVDVLRRVKVLS